MSGHDGGAAEYQSCDGEETQENIADGTDMDFGRFKRGYSRAKNRISRTHNAYYSPHNLQGVTDASTTHDCLRQ